MAGLKVYEALARCFAAEGVDACFGLMGDGNMHWMTEMKNLDGIAVHHARHEHSAVLMAMGYHRATGKVGVASVTCGPGFTQIMTALATAARARIPLVIFAGETPIDLPWYLQEIEQQPLAVACGAEYIGIRSAGNLYKKLQQAFHIARFSNKPVVVGVPYDLQVRQMVEGAYVPSSSVLPPVQPIHPDPAMMKMVAARLASAKVPVILAGKGAMIADAKAELGTLAERSGGVIMTTLLTRGMYDDDPFGLGIAGGYARDVARDVCRKADVVVAFGASLNRYTLDGGDMFPHAELIQIDANPLGLLNGLKTADTYIRADARLAAISILEHLESHPAKSSTIRTDALASSIRDAPADSAEYHVEPGTLDPRRVFDELERVMPKDYHTVCGSGHNSYFHSVMRGGDPARYHAVKEFGVVGSSLALAAGVAATIKHGRVVLYEGDGGLLMHIQELEYLKRQRVKLLIVICNDGAYGSEIHKLRQDGVDESGAIFGRTDLASIARGFGLRGATVTNVEQLEGLLAEYEAQDESMLWDVHISDRVMSPVMRRQTQKRAALNRS